MSQAGFDAEYFKQKDGEQCKMQWMEPDKMGQKSSILKVQETNKSLSGVHHIEFTGKRIGFAGAVAMSEALKKNTTLNSVDLRSLRNCLT